MNGIQVSMTKTCSCWLSVGKIIDILEKVRRLSLAKAQQYTNMKYTNHTLLYIEGIVAAIPCDIYIRIYADEADLRV